MFIKIVDISRNTVTFSIMLRSDRAPHETVHEWTQMLGENDEFTLRPMRVRVGVVLSAE